MLRFLRRTLFAGLFIAIAFTLIAPIAVLAQDSAAIASGAAAGTSGTGIFSALSGYQMLAVTVISSLLTLGISRLWTGFANLGDWGKRGILLVSAWGVTAIVHLLHGNVSADVATLIQTTVQAIAAAFAAGTIFKLPAAKPTP